MTGGYFLLVLLHDITMSGAYFSWQSWWRSR